MSVALGVVAVRAAAAAFLLVALAASASAQLMTLGGKLDVSGTGSATYSIPIAVPPGTAGIVPSLSLEYNSQGGNGLLGLGWSLSGLPAIGRCPRTVAQDGVVGSVNFDANDRFCFGSQRLVVISGTYGADGSEYRTEIEGFSRILAHGTAGNGPAWFEVHTKGGQVMEFGRTTDSLALAQGTATARSWAVDKVADSTSNYFTVTYTNDSANGQAYPIEIDYTGNTAAGLSPYNKVQFVYTTRPDIIPTYQAGSLAQTTVLLTHAKTFAGTALVADYSMTYLPSPLTGRSRLVSVTLCAGDGSCMPATTFTWSNGAAGFTSPSAWVIHGGTFVPGKAAYADVNGDGMADLIYQGTDASGNQAFYVSLSTGSGFTAPVAWVTQGGSFVAGKAAYADVNGDGLVDLIYQGTDSVGNQAFYVSLSTGSGFTSPAVWVTQGGGFVAGMAQYADVNGDGRADLIYQGTDSVGNQAFYVSLSTGSGFTSPVAWVTQGGSFVAGKAHYVDVNGDGRADLVYQGTDSVGNQAFYVSLSTGTGFTSPAVWVTQGGSFVAGKAQFADVNGDGLADLIYQGTDASGNQAFYVSLSTGTGFTSPALWLTQGGSFVAGMAQYADVNGDGMADLIYQGTDATGLQTFYVSLSTGSGFTSPVVWAQQGGGFVAGMAQYADVNGDGRGDLIYQGTDASGNQAFYVSLAAGTHADVVTSITTGLAASTSITYLPLTNASVYTKDHTASYPVRDFQGAYYVAARVDGTNGIGGSYSSAYGYAGATIDVSGRGFMGFRQTTVTDLQTSVVQTTNYDRDFPCITLIDSQTKSLGSQVLNQVVNTYQVLNAAGTTAMSTPTVTAAPYRVLLQQSVASDWDLDGSVIPPVTSTYQYDAYGNATQVVSSTPDGFAKTTVNTYSNDTTNWYLGRLTGTAATSTTP